MSVLCINTVIDFILCVCVCVCVRNVTQFGSDSESVGPKMDACHIMLIRTEISSKNAVGDVQRPHNC